MKKFFCFIILFYSLIGICRVQGHPRIAAEAGGATEETIIERDPKIDNLLKLLSLAKEDTAKVNLLNSLSLELVNKGYNDSALTYANESKKLATHIKFNKGLAGALKNIGAVYYRQAKFEEAIENISQSLKISEEIGDQQGVASAYGIIGLISQYKGNYPEALKRFFFALKIYESFPQTIEFRKYIADVCNNIGVVYFYQGNYAEALRIFSRALEVRKQIGDKQGIARGYIDIGNVYGIEDDYEAALQNYSEALKIQKEIGGKKDMAFTYTNIGIIYVKQEKKYDEALKNYLLALDIFLEQEDRYNASVVYISIGNLYQKQKKYDDSKRSILKGLQLAEETNAKENVKECYLALASLEETRGDFESAYKYYRQYSDVKDSLLNESNNKQINEIKTKYESEKKDEEIQIQTIKIEKQQAAIKYIVGGFTVIVIFTFVYFRLYNQKRKTQFKHQVLETKMEALRAQMNPHFTFNILNSIQYYAGENDMKSVQHYLRQFSKLIRMILDQSRTSYIKLEQEITMLKLYLELEKMRFEKKFTYNVEVADNLNSNKILIPGMLIQPIVENAIKHGIEHKEGEALIDISFFSKNSTLVCKVTDNGIGRAEAARLRLEDDIHISAATSIIAERMEALSSIYDIRLECRTEDLFDHNGKPAGTCVTLEIPIKS